MEFYEAVVGDLTLPARNRHSGTAQRNPESRVLAQTPLDSRVDAGMTAISRSLEMTIYAGAINRDHVHMLIGIPPHISVSKAVQYLKGKSSRRLLSEYASLSKRYWGQHLWGRGYWVASSGNVTDEV
jgi:putative transposase